MYTGVYKDDAPYKVFIDINNVAELHRVANTASGLIVGAGTTLTKAMELFRTSANTVGFEYTGLIGKHIERIANVPVRNVSAGIRYTTEI
jgi:xanthine dehydrogenase/oxidase